MFAIIRRPAPDALQSGGYGYEKWVLEFPRDYKIAVDPLTGNTGTADMMQEVKLSFESKEDAVAYAKTNGIAFQLLERKQQTPKGRSYGENFAFARKFPWTH
ncbi:MAG: ETC complex I subunit [Robiginitomaculum sp.]|nr:ETC complex I subunit [Robiginitomaculum sp.]